MLSPTEWKCPKCHVKVMGRKPACFKCGFHNSTATASPAGAFIPAVSSRGTAGGRRPDWNCPTCGGLIFGSKPSCLKCGTENPAIAAAVTIAAVSSRASAGKRPDWNCPTCSVLIFGSKTSCFKCGSVNPAAISPATTVPENSRTGCGDWPCPKCAFVVFSSKPRCPKCATPRPGGHGGVNSADQEVLVSEREAKLKARERELEERLAGAAATDILAAVPPPAAWEVPPPHGAAPATAPVTLEHITDPDQIACFTAMVAVTSSDKARMKGLHIKNVWRVVNHKLWVQYGTLRQLFCVEEKKPLAYTPRTAQHLSTRPIPTSAERCGLNAAALAPRANEAFLFHGTKHDVAPIVADQGFDERVASLHGLFGGGVYFADDFLKSNAYAALDSQKGTRVMFVSRVLLGNMTDVQPSSALQSQARRAPAGFDTVCGRTNAHEFIVYDRRQTYPEFLFEYAL